MNKSSEWTLDNLQGLDNPSICGNANENAPYLSETFYISSKKHSVFQVRLSEKGLCLRKETFDNVKEQVIQISDIIGCRCLRSQKKHRNKTSPCTCSSLDKVKVEEDDPADLDETDCSAYLYVYAYVLKKHSRNTLKRERTVLTLRFRSFDKFDDNNREAQKWRMSLKKYMKGNSLFKYLKEENQKRMLIILNPKSGKGKARELFQQQVAQIYAEAELSYDLHVTKRANFAREFVRTKDIFSWCGIVVVGGDGIYFEVINGIMERPDWRNVFDTIPIGIIPCGSGNGLARTISHLYNESYEPKPILNAAITTVRAKSCLMDLVRIETRSDIMYSFLSAGWGFISDIDIESERLRYMGYQRFALWSFHRLINLKTYHGRVSYIKANLEGIVENPNCNTLKHTMSCNTYLYKDDIYQKSNTDVNDTDFGEVISLETSGKEEFFRPRIDSWYSATSRKSAYYSITDSVYESIDDSDVNKDRSGEKHIAQLFGPNSNIPSLVSTVTSEWTSEEGEYVMVHAAYQSHLSSDCYFAPPSKLNDGIIWLVVIRAGVTRSQLLNFLLGMSSGTHLSNKVDKLIELIPVTAFRIEPTGNDGIMTVDGERVEYGSIQGEIFPGLVNVMVPK